MSLVSDEEQIQIRSIWSRNDSAIPVMVLAVVDGFVMYRYQGYAPGVMSVREWLTVMRKRSGPASGATRIRRTR